MAEEIYNEIKEKEKRLEYFMYSKGLDGIIISKAVNWAWITAGRNDRIIYSSADSEINLLITKDLKKYCISANVESPRLLKEDLGDLGYESIFFPWYEFDARNIIIQKFIRGKKFASDSFIENTEKLSDEFYLLRYPMIDSEINRYRLLGELSRLAVEETATEVEKGMTEQQIAASVQCKISKNGIFADVLMVGSDERIFEFRHPLTTEKKVNKYVMILINATKGGLCVALTRLVHLGPLPQEIKIKMDKVTEIEAKIAVNCTPDKTMEDITKVLINSYKEAGYPDEWKKHYQGGPIGYGIREYGYDWFPGSTKKFYNKQAFNWNPTITGTKSEDTFLYIDGNIEWLTFKESKNWPIIKHYVDGKVIYRPHILIK